MTERRVIYSCRPYQRFSRGRGRYLSSIGVRYTRYGHRLMREAFTEAFNRWLVTLFGLKLNGEN